MFAAPSALESTVANANELEMLISNMSRFLMRSLTNLPQADERSQPLTDGGETRTLWFATLSFYTISEIHSR